MLPPDVSNNLQPIEKRNVSFVDNNDSWAGSKLAGKMITKDIVKVLKKGAQKWSNTLEVVGQSINFHKSAWQILSYKEVKGSLQIQEKVPMRIHLHDSAGAATKIHQLKSSEPNKGLGYFLTPDGNQNCEFIERMNKTKTVCRGVNSIHTNEHETHKLMGVTHPSIEIWDAPNLIQYRPVQQAG